MKELQDRIRRDAHYLGKGIVKVDTFLNHQIDPQLLEAIGLHIAESHRGQGITRVLTAEVSGIPPALSTARHLGVPLVYARKGEPITLGEDCLRETVMSRTGGHPVVLKISRTLLSAQDRILIVDDFLARGATLRGLANLVQTVGATLQAIVCVVEKPFEGGRQALADLAIPITSLARIQVENDQILVD